MTDTHDEGPTDRLSRREALTMALRLAGAGGVGLALGACSSGRTSGYTPMSAAERARLREPVTIKPYAPVYEGPSTAWAPGSGLAGAIPRAQWAGGQPVPRLMERMKPINKITIHHDGMNAFTTTSQTAARARVEAIRNAHRGQNWGDVGYHYLIDPAGRVWQGRPLEWQGAHVRAQNEGNIGICVMGNYELQRPNSSQLASVERSVAELMRAYRIPLREVRTHREMAATACPGRHMQPRLVAMRSSQGMLARVRP